MLLFGPWSSAAEAATVVRLFVQWNSHFDFCYKKILTHWPHQSVKNQIRTDWNFERFLCMHTVMDACVQSYNADTYQEKMLRASLI